MGVDYGSGPLPTIDPCPDVPSKSDRLTFSARMQAMFNWFPTLRTQLNSVIGSLNNVVLASIDGTIASSSTSLSVSVASKSLTCTAARSYAIGQYVRISRTSDPSGVFMEGNVVSYDYGTGALVVNVVRVMGSGTYSNWTISTAIPAAPSFGLDPDQAPLNAFLGSGAYQNREVKRISFNFPTNPTTINNGTLTPLVLNVPGVLREDVVIGWALPTVTLGTLAQWLLYPGYVSADGQIVLPIYQTTGSTQNLYGSVVHIFVEKWRV